MKKLTPVEESAIESQGDIFAYMALHGYKMDVFTDMYMKSDFVHRYYDNGYSWLQGNDIVTNLDFLLPEIGDKLTQYPSATKLIPSIPGQNGNLGTADATSDLVFDIDVAEWIGQTYRRLNIETNISSSQLIELFPFETMCELYSGMHTIDEQQAIEIMLDGMQDKYQNIEISE